jgi:hypothetical protein
VKRRSLIAAIGVALASASSPSLAQQPMERWYACASIGQSALKIDDSAVGVAGAAASEKKSEVNVHFGVGAGYDFSRALSVRAEFEQAQNLGDRNTTGEGSPSLLSVALVVKF